MIRARLLFLGLALAAALILPASAAAAAPAWSIQSLAVPTNFKPAPSSEKTRYQVFVSNSGGATTDGTAVTITDTLPAGAAVKDIELLLPRSSTTDVGAKACKEATMGEVATVTCKIDTALLPAAEPAKFYPGNMLFLQIELTLAPSAAGTLTNRVEVEGGNAPPASAESQNPVSSEDAGASFEEFGADLTDADGLLATGADSTPTSTPPASRSTWSRALQGARPNSSRRGGA